MATVANYFLILIIGIFVRGSLAKLSDAQAQDFKFQVSLRNGMYGIHLCGGSIVTQKWVITTADCANRIRSNPYIYAGSIYVQDTSPKVRTLQAKRVITHEAFNSQTFENNIAVLEMAETIEYSDSILNVMLPVNGAALPDTAALCGWKPRDTNNPTANRILQVLSDLKFVKQDCRTSGGLPVPLQTGEFCGFDQSTTGTSCLSDPGGALTKDQVLHGLLSRTDCIMQPEIFIQISTYSDWIKATLGDDASDIKWDNTYPGTGGGGGGGGGGASVAECSTFLIGLLSCLYVLIRSF